MFHEFGHALNLLFSDASYANLFIPSDIIELPSKIMENWAFEPEVLKMYARHYKTGQPIPQSLMNKIVAAKMFNQGFSTTGYLAACYLDMDWHLLTTTEPADPIALEKESRKRINLIPEIMPIYRSTHFLHIFGGSGYSAGFYYYIWAEVLDADAFDTFRQKGLFDQKTASAFRHHILANIQTDDAMKQYVRFLGREPDIRALLKRRGLED